MYRRDTGVHLCEVFIHKADRTPAHQFTVQMHTTAGVGSQEPRKFFRLQGPSVCLPPRICISRTLEPVVQDCYYTGHPSLGYRCSNPQLNHEAVHLPQVLLLKGGTSKNC